jgi:hypothetical protein
VLFRGEDCTGTVWEVPLLHFKGRSQKQRFAAGGKVSQVLRLVGDWWRKRHGYVFSLGEDRLVTGLSRHDNCPLKEMSLSGATKIGMWNGTGRDVIAGRIRAGDRCLALMQGDRPVAALWLHRGECYVRGADLWVSASPSAVYCYGVITKQSERCKGYYKKIVEALGRLAVREGVDSIIQYVESSNGIPRVVLPSFGYTQVQIASQRRGCMRHIAVYDPATKTCVNTWRIGEPTGVYSI